MTRCVVRKILPLIVLLLVLSVHVAQADDDLVEQLFGGKDTKIGEYVWFTAIVSIRDTSFRCSGSLIGRRYVVTAGHCVDNALNILVEVSYWCTNRGNCGRSSVQLNVRQVFRHEAERPGEPGGDMVLLELNQPVQLPIRPAVPYLGKAVHPKQRRLKKKRKFTLVGAGRSGTSQGISLYVRKLRLRYLPRKQCKKNLSNPARVTEHTVCSVAEDNDGSPCQGDSGSALVVAGKGEFKDRDLVLGLHSLGPSDCSNPRKDQPFLHFRMEDAKELLQRIICNGQYPEDWCGQQEVTPVPPPPSVSPTPGNPVNSIENLKLSLVHPLGGHSNAVMSVAFNSDGSRLVSTSGDSTMRIWDPIAGGVAVSTIEGLSLIVWSAKWNPSDTLVATGDFSGGVQLWNTNNQVRARSLSPAHGESVHSVAWHPNGVTLASASWDDSIRIWNTESGELLHTIPTPPFSVYSVDFSPDGKLLAAGVGDFTVKVWDATEPSYPLLQTLRGHTEEVWEVAYSPNGELLASASYDDTLRVWRASNGELMHELVGHESDVLTLAWNPSANYLVSGSADLSLRVWDARNGGSAITVVEEAHRAGLQLGLGGDGVSSVDWSPDGAYIASGSWDFLIKIWKVEEN